MQHLEEGTIHAWLDGELSAEEAAAAEAHIRECSECSALVAEARGLIAASTRILTALDDVPSGVIPAETAPAELPRKRHWYDRTDLRAAAAVLLVAGASLVVVQSRQSGVSLKTLAVTDRAATLASPVESGVTLDSAPAGEATHRVAPLTAPPTEALQQTQPQASASGNAAPSEDNALRRYARPPSPEVLRGKVAGARVQPESDMRARDELRKSVAQSAPPPMMVGPQTMITGADTATGMRVGALMDLGRGRGAVSRAGRVEGHVTDQQQGKAVAGASVLVQGTNLSVTTDKEGNFKLDNVPAGEQRLMVRSIGFQQTTVPLSVKDTAITTNVALIPAPTQLNEVVVTSANVATGPFATMSKTSPNLRQIRSDSSSAIRRTVYEYAAGVEVTLTESLPETGMAARRNEKAADAAAAPAPPQSPMADPSVQTRVQTRQTINTISWTDRGRSFTLSGPLATKELEALKARLMAMRR